MFSEKPESQDRIFPGYDRIAVVGNHYASDEAKVVFAELELGSKLLLQRDPKNKYDSNAIRVGIKDILGFLHIGWIPKDRNARLAKAMDDVDELDYYAHVCEISGLSGKRLIYVAVHTKPKEKADAE